MSNRYKLAILIGRFEPLHNGHVSNFKQAFEIADNVQIFVGSSFQPRTIKNPFTYDERKVMIEKVVNTFAHPDTYSVAPLQDYTYSNNDWIRQVQDAIAKDWNVDDKDIAILGFDKDDSSWYNHAFPRWNFFSLKGYVEHGSRPIDATKIRELMFEGHLDFIQGAVPDVIFRELKAFTSTEAFVQLVEEYNHIKEYKNSWSTAPFPPTFVCTDAVVVQGGNILLIQRGFAPGKGLWALPGGFLNQKESTEDACIRELLEETKIKVPEIVLRKAITYQKLFDAPDRSLRGRTLTNAFLIELDGGDGTLPKVKGSDDAKKARWFTLAEVERMSDQLFEDHGHIIKVMVARAKK